MTRSIPSILLCLLLPIALLPYGDSKFAQHPSSSLRSSSNDQEDFPAHRKRGFVPSEDIDQQHDHFLPPTIALTNTTNSTDSNATAPSATAPNATAPTTSPTPATSPEDEKKKDEENKPVKVWLIVTCIIIVVCGVVTYFRDPIFFFFGNAWNNTRRYGCRGCLSSFFPCIFRSRSGGGSETLDQIIFESEDPNQPLIT